jgi:hypothetical protein
MKRTTPAKIYAAAKMKGTARDGTPIERAKFPITFTKFGPATAPNVVEAIVILKAVGHCLLFSKSVPA